MESSSLRLVSLPRRDSHVTVLPVHPATSAQATAGGSRLIDTVLRASDLRQGHAQRICRALHGQDKGVLVGVLLNDAVVHVHQDPGDRGEHREDSQDS